MNANILFDEHRRLLFGIAYRMLGSVQDAEDAVQETFIRWHKAEGGEIENPRAYLSTIVTRVCIDVLKSARKQREEYVGEWLPEPYVSTDPQGREPLDLAESLSTAFLLLLERLNPTERAAFLLREVFDYPYDQIAEMLDKSEVNCRQIVKRAKDHVKAPRLRFETSADEHERVVASFMGAANSGDTESLMKLLAEKATFHADHGGKAIANKRVIHGADKVARFFVGISTRFPPEDVDVRIAPINGKPGVIVYSKGAPYSVFQMEIKDGRIETIYATRNPDKLTRIPAPDALN